MIATSKFQFSEAGLIRSISKKSFYCFFREFWPVLVPDKPLIDNWHIKYLCDSFQEEAELVFAGKEHRYDMMIINISPGSTKSSIFSIMAPAWIWTRMISAGIIGSSYTYSLAADLSRKCRTIVKSEKYSLCFPEFKISIDQDAKGHFTNTKRGERNCAGIDGDITGRHADFIFIDDPLNPRGARSEAEVKSSNTYIEETLLSRKRDKRTAFVVLIMQRLCQNDASGLFLKQAKEGKIKVKHICMPAEVGDNVYPSELKNNYKDGLMDVERLPKSVLDKERVKGKFYYSGQFDQRPVPLGGGMFLVDKIITIPSAPLHPIKIVRYWDKAGTSKGGAFTAGVKLCSYKKNDQLRYCITHAKRGQWDAGQREAIIKQTAVEDGIKTEVVVEQEPGSGGLQSADITVKNLAGYVVKKDRPTGDKEWRADAFASQVNIGNVDIVEGDWNTDYLSELQFFPYSEFKDQVDASSGAFKMLGSNKSVGVW